MAINCEAVNKKFSTLYPYFIFAKPCCNMEMKEQQVADPLGWGVASCISSVVSVSLCIILHGLNANYRII